MGLFAKRESVSLTIGGMTCGNCVKHVTDALQGVAGVAKVAVDLDGSATVQAAVGTKRDALVAAVVAAGYEAS